MMPFLVSFWDSTIQIWDNFKVWMGEFFDSISSVWNTFRPWDIVDVILVAYLVYLGIKLVRETRAGQLVKGLILLGAFYVLASVLQLSTLEFIIQKVFDIGIVAVIVIFQPELRRALEKFGRTRMTDFGAFVELEPGVDQLLHLNNIYKEHVDKPSDVLSVGQVITAKVVDFNEADRKISLSMKALENQEAEEN